MEASQAQSQAQLGFQDELKEAVSKSQLEKVSSLLTRLQGPPDMDVLVDSFNRKEGILELLLESGANPCGYDSEGLTPMDYVTDDDQRDLLVKYTRRLVKVERIQNWIRKHIKKKTEADKLLAFAQGTKSYAQMDPHLLAHIADIVRTLGAKAGSAKAGSAKAKDPVCKVNVETGRCSQKGTIEPGSCRRDPTTKRCKRKTERRQERFKPTPKRKFKPCPAGKVRNPQTNRCIAKTHPSARNMRLTNETTTIGGAVTLSYYEVEVPIRSHLVTKRILLFGDEHTRYPYDKHPSVITTPTLLKKIIRRSPHCIDLFVERQVDQKLAPLRAQGKFLGAYGCPLNAVREEFGACPIHHKTKAGCPYENLRYQNWDLRFAHQKSNPYDELLMIPSIHKRFLQTFTKTHTLQHALQYIIGSPIPPSTEARWDTFFTKEIDAQPASFKKRVTGTDFQTYRKEVIQRAYRKVMTDVAFPKDLVHTFLQMYSSIGLQDVGEFTHVFTDFYLICRMFQNFGTKGTKGSRTPKRCPVIAKKGKESYATPTYLIVYAGEDHIKYVHTFLESMFSRSCRQYHTGTPRWNKRISLQELTFSKAFPKPETLDGLFQPFYE